MREVYRFSLRKSYLSLSRVAGLGDLVIQIVYLQDCLTTDATHPRDNDICGSIAIASA